MSTPLVERVAGGTDADAVPLVDRRPRWPWPVSLGRLRSMRGHCERVCWRTAPRSLPRRTDAAAGLLRLRGSTGRHCGATAAAGRAVGPGRARRHRATGKLRSSEDGRCLVRL